MALQKILSYAERLEDPNHPLMGPNLKGLYFFGLRQNGSKLRTVIYNTIHLSTFVFVFTQFVDLYQIRADFNMVLNNMSLNVLSVICVTKCYSLIYHQRKWFDLIDQISEMEKKQLRKNDESTIRIMKEYTLYTRVVTYLFWVMVFVTNLFLIVSPFFKCVFQSYREDIVSGKEPLPQIMFSWFPFDNKEFPGYIFGIFVHIFMGCQGSGVIAVFDMNAVGIMNYLKGQMMILRDKSRKIFDCESKDIVLCRIRECHEHHTMLVKQYKILDSLLSPPMFLYVLVCSMTICGSVVQFTSKGASTSQKVWVVQYTLGLVSQLFLYCWHANEVTVEASTVDRGVYESDWWKGDKNLRRLIILLSGKLDQTLILNAGPYATLSVHIFVEIIRASYSFFTLFSQMYE